MWKNEKFTHIEKTFRQINSLVISLVKTSLSRNFCQKCVRPNRSLFSHCAVLENEKISQQNILSEFNSLVTSLVKTSLSRNICQKNARVNCYNFHTVHVKVF